MMLVAVQLSVPGLYLPPVFKSVDASMPSPDDHLVAGPHCRVIVSTSWCALVVLVAVQLFVTGIVSSAGV